MKRLSNLNKKRGFSFVELMIAVSIFGLLSTLTVSSYANFNNRIGVDTLAHQIAQFGHEAQVSALSVKRASDGNFPGYGIHFDKSTTTQFIFFADLNNNKLYDAGGTCGSPTSECEKTIKLLKGVTINALCGNATVGGIEDGANCKTAGMLHGSEMFDIVFRRPSPDASIIGKVSAVATPGSYSSAQVVISSAKGYKRSVAFYITGQVTVK